MKSIHQTVLDENPDTLYWWSKWPKNPREEQQHAIDFLLERYPKTIAIGVQEICDLMVSYKEK